MSEHRNQANDLLHYQMSRRRAIATSLGVVTGTVILHFGIEVSIKAAVFQPLLLLQQA